MKTLSQLSIFTGSFLLFLVQPLIGNFLLPYFGGTAAVWIVCLCVFQVLLIAGYAYAHWLSGLKSKYLHVGLLFVAALVFCPLSQNTVVWAARLGNPMMAIVLFLLAAVGLPYVLVGANGTLIQAIHSRDEKVYDLYAVSNLGSFAGLLGYPLLLEPYFTISRQFQLVSLGMGVYALLLTVLLMNSQGWQTESVRQPLTVAFRDRDAVRWFLLSLLSCFLLDSISAHLCMDVTPIPLMWCVLLAVYLLSWAVAFNDRGASAVRITAILSLLLAGVAFCRLQTCGGRDAYFLEFPIGILLLFFGCWFVHARLYGLRPAADRLTGYYFIIAIGGAVGGVLCCLAAPLLFSAVAEYPIALAGVVLCVTMYFSDRLPWMDRKHSKVLLMVIAATIATAGFFRLKPPKGKVVYQCRNFYGTTQLIRFESGENLLGKRREVLAMANNGTTHGFQVVGEGDWRLYSPTTYYTELGGGRALIEHPLRKAKKPLRAAFLGMGIGTMAFYGNAGDLFRFFEINPDVVRVATDKRYFTFVCKSDAAVETVTDDARKALEREDRTGVPPYDLIVVDVFSGDSIPAHMATAEAVQLYLRRLAPDGVLAFHVTNWHLNLFPLMKAIGREFSLKTMGIASVLPLDDGYNSLWAYFSRKDLSVQIDRARELLIDFSRIEDIPLMTDNFHPMLGYLCLEPVKKLSFVMPSAPHK